MVNAVDLGSAVSGQTGEDGRGAPQATEGEKERLREKLGGCDPSDAGLYDWLPETPSRRVADASRATSAREVAIMVGIPRASRSITIAAVAPGIAPTPSSCARLPRIWR